MREDEGALGEDEADGELEDEEEALHVGGLADAAVIPVEAAGLVVAEALLLVHAAAVLGGPDPGGRQVGHQQPGLVGAPPPDGDDVDVAPAGVLEGAAGALPAGAGPWCQVADGRGAAVRGPHPGLALDPQQERPAESSTLVDQRRPG